MYQQIKDLPFDKQVEAITRELVGVKSVNGTKGETEMAERLEDIVRSYPYFKAHPDHVWTQSLENDPLGRKNLFAFLESEKPSQQTVIYHGHVDTVGIDDFGKLEPYALDPDALLEFFKRYDKDQEAREDALSGDWLFGRGALDMKSGDAVHLCNLLYYSEHRERLRGNVLVMFNPVEENDHSGMMAATKELIRLKKERQLDYLAAINSDFVSPLYKDDPHRYIYTGAVGKLLGCFYIRGREAHVGETVRHRSDAHCRQN
ncbi:M20/M25/M40 family metallo-hydrolase [Terrilactibacillus sp. S3-3]|nr:M20/M25/M40 family metallo-hydrolase [Terrilactibacillus sp. S3-3]